MNKKKTLIWIGILAFLALLLLVLSFLFWDRNQQTALTMKQREAEEAAIPRRVEEPEPQTAAAPEKATAPPKKQSNQEDDAKVPVLSETPIPAKSAAPLSGSPNPSKAGEAVFTSERSDISFSYPNSWKNKVSVVDEGDVIMVFDTNNHLLFSIVAFPAAKWAKQQKDLRSFYRPLIATEDYQFTLHLPSEHPVLQPGKEAQRAAYDAMLPSLPAIIKTVKHPDMIQPPAAPAAKPAPKPSSAPAPSKADAS